jgi:hypothetical protein
VLVPPGTGAGVAAIAGIVSATGAGVAANAGIVSATGAGVAAIAGIVSATGAGIAAVAGVVSPTFAALAGFRPPLRLCLEQCSHFLFSLFLIFSLLILPPVLHLIMQHGASVTHGCGILLVTKAKQVMAFDTCVIILEIRHGGWSVKPLEQEKLCWI